MKFAIFFFLLFFCCLMVTAQNETIIVDDKTLGSGTHLWTADNSYIIDGLVYLEAGGKLTIEAGTTIKVKVSPSGSDPVSALIITKGASFLSLGEYLSPVIFTIEDDMPFLPGSEPEGYWGGVIILGDHPIMDMGSALPKHLDFLDSIDERNTYGGTGESEAICTLRWTSIQYAGSFNESVGPALTLAGLSSASIVDGVEVFQSAGDGFRFLGGSVNTRQLSASFCKADAFSWADGFTGKGQNWFMIQDGDAIGHALRGSGQASRPVIYNGTFIGPGQNSSGEFVPAIRLDGQSGLELGMSIIGDFPNKGLFVENIPGEKDSYAKISSGEILFQSNVWTEFGAGNVFTGNGGLIDVTGAEDPTASILANALLEGNVAVGPYFTHISRKPNRMLNPDVFFDGIELPDQQYPIDEIIQETLGTCAGFGAFQSVGAWWLQHWTALDEQNYLMHPCFLDFFASSGLSFQGGDTVRMTCEQLDQLQLDQEYGCMNNDCDRPNQQPSLVMRRRRSKSAIRVPDQEYCYIQEVVFEGEERLFILDPYDFDKNIVGEADTFEVAILVQVIDTIGPQWQITPCSNCDLGIEIIPIDCDTAWITEHMQIELDNNITRYIWKALDRCANQSVLEIKSDERHPGRIFYQDLDGDGYGSEIQLAWKFDSLPGFVLASGDCNDLDFNIYPGSQLDMGKNVDYDCDGIGNIERCDKSDVIPINQVCDYRTYGWNPSVLENNSATDCTFALFPDEGDVWLKTVVPASGEVTMNYETDVDLFQVDVLKGSCSSLQTIQCLAQENEILLENLPEGDTVTIRFNASSSSEGLLDICFHDESIPTATTKITSRPVVSLFPNPTEDKMTILSSSWNGISRVQIKSITGSMVKSIEVAPHNQKELKIDVSTIPSGSYFVNIVTEKGVQQQKFIRH